MLLQLLQPSNDRCRLDSGKERKSRRKVFDPPATTGDPTPFGDAGVRQQKS
jgi:hypothetical protein